MTLGARHDPDRKRNARASVAGAVSLHLATVLTSSPSSASEIRSSIAFMHGLWAGEGYVVLVDACRHLGRFGTKEPFAFGALRVRDVTDDLVVFLIGERQLIGLFDGDALTITGHGIDGSPVLQRVDALGLSLDGSLSCPTALF